MSESLEKLIEHLTLEKIEENFYRGSSEDPGWGRVFGGQVLAQALSAAIRTVPKDRPIHSFHSYFLLPGDVDHPIIFRVKRLRDGSTFSTREVEAIQHGRPIYAMLASFQAFKESYVHQDEMPDAPPPESLKPTWQLNEADIETIPEPLRQHFTTVAPIDQRPVKLRNPFNPDVRPPHSMRWVKANGDLPDDPNIHRAMLAYSSDFQFLDVSMYPHGTSWVDYELQVASLDHTIYFHRPFRFDEWLLFVTHSPNMSGSRGLVKGSVFTRDGKLVATALQEGLIRFRK